MSDENVDHFHACNEATTNSMKEHKLRKFIAFLSDKEGRAMEFVSLYIPQGASLYHIIETIKKESDSAVMKPEKVTKHLQDALKGVIQLLKQEKDIRENGLALFAGAFVQSDSENEALDIEEVVPPMPIVTYLFEVDDHFHLEPLREMLREQKIVGVLILDSKEASFGILDGERLELVENITSGVPGKSGKGGQSQRRYERERDMEITYFFQRVAEHASKAFLENCRVAALIVGGPGLTKQDFLKSDHLHYVLKSMLLSVVDTQFTGKDGVKEALDKSSEALKNICWPEEKKTLKRLFAEVGKQSGLAVCGLDSVLEALRNGEVEVVLVTDNSDMIEAVATCKNCGLSKTKIMNKSQAQAMQEMISTPCEKCSAVQYEVEKKDIVDVLEDAASQTDAKVEVISIASEEKAKLASLGGFAALLRYTA